MNADLLLQYIRIKYGDIPSEVIESMYVCICNAIRESDFRTAARRASGDAEAVYAELGKQPKCRQCLKDADALLAELRAADRKLRLVA